MSGYGFTGAEIAQDMRNYADIEGAEHPERAWIAHPSLDMLWARNPHYRGPPVPHPEEYDYADEPEVLLDDVERHGDRQERMDPQTGYVDG
jgi:hypothetical protein